MTKTNIIDIRSYYPEKIDRFFLDTNIWLYIFGPIADYKKRMIAPYSGFLDKIIKNRSMIYISSLVLIEFIRGYLNIEIGIFSTKNKLNRRINFKEEFRATPEHGKALLAIEKEIKNILKISKKIGDKFESINIDDLFKDLEKIDINDNYYLTLASIEQLKIITHDADFGVNKNVSILTANGKLLQP